ncbi:DUF397 domain-containing protein [Streptomyces sp. NPDC087532]|uniref:DUF397 domain-containing protein n=1 Tax=Streptomyces sp. NPDC087532 TaxID=3365795 RepID=UPI0037F701FE
MEFPLKEELVWSKSSYSGQNGGDCVEYAIPSKKKVLVRDSKHSQGPRLAFSSQVWTSFVAAATDNSLSA